MHEVCQIGIVFIFLVLERRQKAGFEKNSHEVAKMTKLFLN